ncbi:MAG TPA: hypothetical protein VLC98_12480 [Phnomibacter sp.]|nr:hypothetical protein [Phnomibacter sp.]
MRYTSYLTGFSLLTLAMLSTADLRAQYYEQYDRYNDQSNVSIRGSIDFAVGSRPEAPWVRPAPAPSQWHVWISNEWQWHNGRYVCVPGHWVRPAYTSMRYVPGYWNRTKHGWVWRQGHWNEGNHYGYSKGHGNGNGNGHGKGKGNGHKKHDH